MIKAGINYIDTAPWYGQGRSEEVLGAALADVPRGAYYLATKVGRYDLETAGMFDFSAERVRRSVLESLARLRLDYIDLIQVRHLGRGEGPDGTDNDNWPGLRSMMWSSVPAWSKLSSSPSQHCSS